MIPSDTRVAGDTIDALQREETSNGALSFNDSWHVTPRSQFQFSGFYRYYTLDVRPNFGDGLIRQSEHRNVNSEDVLYENNFNRSFSVIAGADLRREAPRALDLDHIDRFGALSPVTPHNITVNFFSPFIAADATLLHSLHYNLGYRRDEVKMDNRDLYRKNFSFSRSS